MTTLLSAIAASTGPHDFPARIDTTAVALSDLAATRLSLGFEGAKLRQVCEALRQLDADVIDGRCGSFTADDIKVIAFFLAANKSVHQFECVVRPARCCQPVPQRAHPRQRGAATSDLEQAAPTGLPIQARSWHDTPARRLGGNEIGDVGASALSEALKVNATLTMLECVHVGSVARAICAPARAR